MAPPLTWRPVHSLRVEAAKRRSHCANGGGGGGQELRLPEKVWGGTVEDLEEWFVTSQGFSGSPRLGVDGFALLPSEPLRALLREKDEVMVSSVTSPAPGSLTDGDIRKPKAKRPKAIADAPGPPTSAKAAPVAPGQRAAAPSPPVALSAPVAPSAPEKVRGQRDELEALVKEQARRIRELEEQNTLLRRKLKAMAEPPAAPAEATAGRWMASTVEELKKGHVICYQLDLIDAWKGAMQRSEAKVAVITKVSRNAAGSRCFGLRCERGGVDFLEAAQLRNVQRRAGG